MDTNLPTQASEISETESETSDFSPEAVQDEIAGLLRRLSLSERFQSVKGRIRRASRLTGLSFSRVRSLWYGEARSILAHEADLIRARAGTQARTHAREARRDEDGIKTELALLRRQVSRIEEKLHDQLEKPGCADDRAILPAPERGDPEPRYSVARNRTNLSKRWPLTYWPLTRWPMSEWVN